MRATLPAWEEEGALAWLLAVRGANSPCLRLAPSTPRAHRRRPPFLGEGASQGSASWGRSLARGRRGSSAAVRGDSRPGALPPPPPGLANSCRRARRIPAQRASRRRKEFLAHRPSTGESDNFQRRRSGGGRGDPGRFSSHLRLSNVSSRRGAPPCCRLGARVMAQWWNGGACPSKVSRHQPGVGF